ncbi:MAG: hypothetical protein LW807_07560 [Proteobacteria bacterium]|jgi:hypothetical protein|nr:hypothetical protein [Pseudomonadota bacterium]
MEVVKVLGRTISDATELIELYTVPENKGCVISTLNICNLDLYDANISIAIAPAGISKYGLNNEYYLELNMMVYGNCSSQRLKGITLASGDTIYVYGSTELISFNVFGSEFDQSFQYP